MAAAKTTATEPVEIETPVEETPESPFDPAETGAAYQRSGLSVFQRVALIKSEAGPLAKTRASSGIKFAFRGIDGVVNHLAPFLAKYEVTVVPNVLDRVTTKRNVGDKVITNSDVHTSFTVYGPDGDSFTGSTVGLADDYSDRSASQAESVALRVFLLQTFMLPTDSPEPEETGQAVLELDEKNAAERRKIDRARKPDASTPKPVDKPKEEGAPAVGDTSTEPSVSSLKNELRAIIDDASNSYTSEMVNALWTSRAKTIGKNRNTRPVLEATLAAVAAGEVA